MANCGTITVREPSDGDGDNGAPPDDDDGDQEEILGLPRNVALGLGVGAAGLGTIVALSRDNRRR